MKAPKRILVGTALVLGVGACSEEERTLPPEPELDPSQQVVYSDVRPPPVSGGTLLVSRDAKWVIAADPDRDRVMVVEAASLASREIPLEPGDEPGRVIEDEAGNVHVALRSGGAIVTIDPVSAKVLSRREVCAAPRGLASFAPVDDVATIFVACADGDLVELEGAPSGGVLKRIEIEPDLRDVVVTGSTRADRRVLVSTFRTPRVITLEPDDTFGQDSAPLDYATPITQRGFSPTVAWRMIPDVTGGALMLHQRSTTVTLDESVPPGSSYYGGFDCDTGVVLAAAARFDKNGQRTTPKGMGGVTGAILTVDASIAGDRMFFVSMGSESVGTVPVDSIDASDPCDFGSQGYQVNLGPEPIAVAAREVEPPSAENLNGKKEVFVQLRQPSMIVVLDQDLTWVRQAPLGGASRRDTGHKLFHGNPDGAAIAACASCHAEGRDDAHVWQFVAGARRTQNLSGGILETAPFHWEGELEDMSALMTTVFQERMGGQHQSDERVGALASWVDAVPRIPQRAFEDAAVARGKATFERADVACATCHSGKLFTNNESRDVGTGGKLQVPSLRGVRDRAPYMHDGCAPTLRDRFDGNGKCGGTDHGDVSDLSEAEIDDLVTYMMSL